MTLLIFCKANDAVDCVITFERKSGRHELLLVPLLVIFIVNGVHTLILVEVITSKKLNTFSFLYP